MRDVRIIIAALFPMCFPCLCGAQDVPVDISELAACTNIEKTVCFTNGWECYGVSSYQADYPNIRFSVKDEYIVSTNYNTRIVGFSLSVKSSSGEGRRLTIVPFEGDSYDCGKAIKCDYTASADKYEKQEHRFASDVFATKFRLMLEKDGSGSTAWGISNLTVVVSSAPLPKVKNLNVSKMGSYSAALSWENLPGAVSNEVSVHKLSYSIPADETIGEWDFGFVENSGGNNKDISEEVFAKYSALSGRKLMAKSNANGFLQVGTGDELGLVVIAALDDYTGCELKLDAKRYDGDKNETTVGYVMGEKTNEVFKVSLGEEFAEHAINVSSFPPSSRIIVNAKAAKSKQRFYLRSLSLARRVELTEVSRLEKVCAFSKVNAPSLFPDAGGEGFVVNAMIRHLLPGQAYKFGVKPFNENKEGGEEIFSDVVSTLDEKGLKISIR